MNERKAFSSARKVGIRPLDPTTRATITSVLIPGEVIICVVRSAAPRRSLRRWALDVLVLAITAAAVFATVRRWFDQWWWVVLGVGAITVLWYVKWTIERRHIVATDQRLITMITGPFHRVRFRSRNHDGLAYVDVVRRLVLPGTVVGRRSNGRRVFTQRWLREPVEVAAALQCLVGRIPADERPAPTVFISFHSHPNGDKAHALYQALNARLGPGTCFKDSESIRPAERWNEALVQSIEASTAVLVLLGTKQISKLNDETDWVRRELLHALAHNVPVVIVATDGSKPFDATRFPYQLNGALARQAVRLHAGAVDFCYDQLADAVRGLALQRASALRASRSPRCWVVSDRWRYKAGTVLAPKNDDSRVSLLSVGDYVVIPTDDPGRVVVRILSIRAPQASRPIVEADLVTKRDRSWLSDKIPPEGDPPKVLGGPEWVHFVL